MLVNTNEWIQKAKGAWSEATYLLIANYPMLLGPWDDFWCMNVLPVVIELGGRECGFTLDVCKDLDVFTI